MPENTNPYVDKSGKEYSIHALNIQDLEIIEQCLSLAKPMLTTQGKLHPVTERIIYLKIIIKHGLI